MKLDQLRKIIREEVRAAVKEELQDVINEAVKIASTPTKMQPAPEAGTSDWSAAKKPSKQELAEMMAKITGYPGEINWDTSKPDGTPKRPLDYTKLLDKGWKPKYKLMDGLRKTYEWYIEHTDLQTK